MRLRWVAWPGFDCFNSYASAGPALDTDKDNDIAIFQTAFTGSNDIDD